MMAVISNSSRLRIPADTKPVTKDKSIGWPVASQHFNPAVMRGSYLERVNNSFEFVQDPVARRLFCFAKLSDNVYAGAVPCDTEAARRAFLSDIRNGDSSSTVLQVCASLGACFAELDARYFHLGNDGKKVSMESCIWDWILDEFDVYPEWPAILRQPTGRYSKAVTYCKDTLKPAVYHIMVNHPSINTALNDFNNGFYIQCHFDSGRIFMLCHCVLPDFLCTQARDRSSQTNGAWPGQDNPFPLAIDRLVDYLEDLNRSHEVFWPKVWDMEVQISLNAEQQGELLQKPDLENLDLEKMNAVCARIRHTTYQVDFQLRLSEFLHATHIHFVSMRQAAGFSPKESEVDTMRLSLYAHRDRVSECLSSWKQCQDRAEHKLRIANTIISTWIAKQSHLTASEARKDNNAMKTIAGLSMVYLPSTFVATIFSMGFFTFGSGDNGGGLMKVHSDLWKFIAIAVTLTLLTISVWMYLNAKGTPWFLHGHEIRTALYRASWRRGKVKETSIV